MWVLQRVLSFCFCTLRHIGIKVWDCVCIFLFCFRAASKNLARTSIEDPKNLLNQETKFIIYFNCSHYELALSNLLVMNHWMHVVVRFLLVQATVDSVEVSTCRRACSTSPGGVPAAWIGWPFMCMKPMATTSWKLRCNKKCCRSEACFFSRISVFRSFLHFNFLLIMYVTTVIWKSHCKRCLLCSESVRALIIIHDAKNLS